MSETKPEVPVTFWIIAGLGLVWNLIGVFFFFQEVFMSEEAFAALSENDQSVRNQIPSYLNIAFGMAVFGGVLGCIVLLIRKEGASLLLLISLIATIIHMGYGILMTDTLKLNGNSVIIQPVIFVLIAGFLYFYAMRCQSRGWLQEVD